jgi:hypothetical protein
MKSKIVGLVIPITVFLITIDAFAAQYNFTPRAAVRETYNDNIFLTDKNKEDDFITSLSAGGTFQALGKTSGLELISDPSYQWFADNTSDDYWRVPATLDIWSNISRRTKFEIFDRFLRDTDRVDDNPVIREEDGQIRAPGDTTDRRGREWFYTNYATARADHKFGSDDSVYAQFLYSLRREEDSDTGNENDRIAPSAGITYWFGPKWGTTINAVYTKAKFDNSPDYDDIAGMFQLMRRFSRTFQIFGRYGYANRDNDDDVPDYQAHAPSAGIIYDVAKDARLTIGGGYYYQDFKDSDIDDEEGFFVNGDVYKRWNYQRWNARLSGQAGLDRNDYGSERLGFEWFAGIIANARYSFTRNFYGDVNARYRYGDFINADRQDHRIRAGVGLGWQPTQWMDLNLAYNFNKLDSTDSENYDENRVWLQVKLQPDKPWRF